MDIFVSLKNLINHINEIDKKSKNIFIESDYTHNPFAAAANKTYVWLDPVKENPQCKYKNIPKD